MGPIEETYLRRCAGLRIADAWRGNYTTVFFELGTLYKHSNPTRKKSKGKGEVTLMLDCRWRLESKRSIVCGSFDTHGKVERQLAGLIGKRILGTSFAGRLPELVVELEGDRWIQSFTSHRHECWALIFRKQGSIGRSGRRLLYEPLKLKSDIDES